jgi:hypothetical protein
MMSKIGAFIVNSWLLGVVFILVASVAYAVTEYWTNIWQFLVTYVLLPIVFGIVIMILWKIILKIGGLIERTWNNRGAA